LLIAMLALSAALGLAPVLAGAVAGAPENRGHRAGIRTLNDDLPPIVPQSPPDTTVDYGVCATCNVPAYLLPGSKTLVFKPAATAVFGHVHQESNIFGTCSTATLRAPSGLEAGFQNYDDLSLVNGCTINFIWQAGFRFDLHQLREARATGRWLPTDAVLTFKETPYPGSMDDASHAGYMRTGEGDYVPTATCQLRLAVPTIDWSGGSRDLVPNDVIREAGEIGRWNVYSELLGMVVDADSEQKGFVILGHSESMDANQAGCRSKIDDLQLTVNYTIGTPPASATSPTPAPLRIVEARNAPNSCAICSALETPTAAPPPTLPDFNVPVPSGDKNLGLGVTSTYTIAVSNKGARPPTQITGPTQAQLQIQIQVSGAVEYVSMAQTPAGWDCNGTGPVLCVGQIGGYGDPVQNLQVSFQVRVRGAKAGIGSISAAADPNGLIQESDKGNNASSLAITVK
jgi:hypothetical protein